MIDAYRANPALGSTDIKNVLKDPRFFSLTKWHGYNKRTEALDFGDMFHTFLLEPQKFEERYVLKAYDSFRTNEAKEWRDMQTQIIYDNKALAELDFLKKKAMSVPGVEKFMTDPSTQIEQEFYGEIDGTPVKCKIDVLTPVSDGHLTVDPKTMAGACTPENCAKQAKDFDYGIQEWLYREVLRQNGINLKEYLFWFISKTDYSNATLKRLSPQAVEHAESLTRTAINKYKIFLDKYGSENPWPECEEVDQTMDYPLTAYYKYIGNSEYCPEGVFLTS